MQRGLAAFRTFVGRERELDLLQRGLNGAIGGRGALFLVGGARGVGKTSLARQVAREAQALGVRSIFVDRELRDHREAIPAVAFDAGAFAKTDAPVTPPQGDLNDCPDRDSSAEVLRTATFGQPTVLIFDDVHRWRPDSLSSLALLARNICDAPALAVATYCEGAVQRDPVRRSLFAHLVRFGFYLALAELDEAATCEFVKRLVGRDPDPRLAREIFHATGGNPLLLEQTLQLWFADRASFENSQFQVDKVVIPPPVRDLFTSLFSELSGACRQVLDIAAVLGDEITLNVLARVSGLSDEKLLDAVDEAEEARLLMKDPDRSGHFGFRHRLARQLLYCGLSSFRRAELHYQVARATQELRSAAPGVASQIVEHLRQALNKSGYHNQANGNSDSGAQWGAKISAEFFVWLGENQVRAGLCEAAQATLTTAVELADRTGDTASLAKIALALPNYFLPLPSAPNFAAAFLTRNVLSRGQTLDAELRAPVCARLAAELSYVPEAFDRAGELMNEALTLASGCAPTLQLLIHVYRDFLLRGPLDLDERINNASKLSDLAAKANDCAVMHLALVVRAIAHLERGEIALAWSAWDGAVAAAGSAPAPCEGLSIEAYRASRAFCEGRLKDARTLLQQTGGIGTIRPSDFVSVAVAMVLREQGLALEALDAAEKVAERSPESATYCAVLALTKFDLGRERDARFYFEGLFGNPNIHFPHDAMFLPNSALLAELSLELRDAERAAQVYSALIPYGSHFVVFGQGLILGPVPLYLGMLAIVQRRFELARQHLEEALKMSRKSKLRLWSAYTNYRLAECLVQAGDSASALQFRECMEEAAAEAEGLGLIRLLNKVRSLQGSVPRSGAPSNDLEQKDACDGLRQAREATATVQAKNDNELEFHEEGETCLLVYRGRNLRVRKSKGLNLILALIRSPGRDIHVLDLECAAGNSYAWEGNCAGEGDPQLDASAKHSYRLRLQDLREELEEARRFNDSHRASMIEEEMGFLARELARAVGLKGSDRKTFSDAERARARVTQAIRSALRKISQRDSVIGWYLASAVRTGTFCCYRTPEDGNNSERKDKNYDVTQNLTHHR